MTVRARISMNGGPFTEIAIPEKTGDEGFAVLTAVAALEDPKKCWLREAYEVLFPEERKK